MLKLATILDNPGEPTAQTRYRQPRQLRDLGYTGLVLFDTTALSGIDSPDSISSGEMRRWVSQQLDATSQRITQAQDAGLDVYVVYDVLSLARDVVEGAGDEMMCRNRRGQLCPASETALARSVNALRHLLQRLPDVAGVAIRFGDNDAGRLPYLVGNDIYSPHCSRCSVLGRADRIVSVVESFSKLVIGELDKRLIVRAWNIRPNGMHDSVDLCQRLADRLPLPDDERLVLSFKFTHTDFWRYQKWNPCSLTFGNRPVIYEVECQREFEGKGGIPNWQPPLWRDGGPETPNAVGLADVSKQVRFAGLWAWVRGGGWGGPFVQNESWIDANAYAVPRLADQPDAPLNELAEDWIRQRLGVEDAKAVEALRVILEHSPDVILKSFYIDPYARGKVDSWHPNADWIQDDLIDAEAMWRIVQRLPEDSLEDVMRNKSWAVNQVVEDRSALHRAIEDQNASRVDPLVNTLTYAESLLQTIRDLVSGLIYYRRYKQHGEVGDADLCRQRLFAAQSHWNHHTQRHGSLAGAATAFRESNFWDLTQRLLADVTKSTG